MKATNEMSSLPLSPSSPLSFSNSSYYCTVPSRSSSSKSIPNSSSYFTDQLNLNAATSFPLPMLGPWEALSRPNQMAPDNGIRAGSGFSPIPERSESSMASKLQSPDLPNFTGKEDVQGWLHRAEQLLDSYNFSGNLRVMMAVLYLKGAPLEWYRGNVRAKGMPLSWAEFKKGLISLYDNSKAYRVFDEIPKPLPLLIHQLCDKIPQPLSRTLVIGFNPITTTEEETTVVEPATIATESAEELISQCKNSFKAHKVFDGHSQLNSTPPNPSNSKGDLAREAAYFTSQIIIMNHPGQVGNGLDYCHRCKIVQRGVKPTNLLINANHQVKIADFGISRILAQTMDPCNSSVGTLFCMNPERINTDRMPTRNSSSRCSTESALGVSKLKSLMELKQSETMLIGLDFLDIADNQLVGPVLDSIENCLQLQLVDLSNNTLSEVSLENPAAESISSFHSGYSGERTRVISVSMVNLKPCASLVHVALTASGGTPERHQKKIKVCHHINVSVSICKYEKDDWKTLQKGQWSAIISPYEKRYIDIRSKEKLPGSVIVMVEEEFQQWCLSWHWFWFSSAYVGTDNQHLGPILCLQCMCPGSCVGSCIVLYFSLVNSILVNFGLSEEMHYPVLVMFLVLIILAGAALGYWIVGEYVHSEDGSVDAGIILFVKWAIIGEKEFAGFLKWFISLYLSDQHSASYRKILVFKFVLPDVNEMAEMTRSVTLLLYYRDLIGRSKTEAIRKKVAQEVVVGRPAIKTVLQPHLPQLALIWFLVLLPKFLMMLSNAEGIPSKSHAIRASSGRYLYFIMFNVFLGVTITGMLFTSMKTLINKPNSVEYMLAENLPVNATFFLTFVALKSFVGNGLELSRLAPLIIFQLEKKYLCRTKAEVKEAWALGDLGFATRVLNDMLIVTIVLCHSVIASLIIPFGAIYFDHGWFIARNQVLKVCVPSYMPDIFNLMMKAVREEEEPIALQAIEFWSSICDGEIDILDDYIGDFTSFRLLAITQGLGTVEPTWYVFLQYTDQMMEMFGRAAAYINTMMHEEARRVIVDFTYATEANFLKCIQMLNSYLEMGLQIWEYEVRAIIVGVVGNFSRASEGMTLLFGDDNMSHLLKNLSSTQHRRSMKPLILSCLANSVLAIGVKSEKYLCYAMPMLQNAIGISEKQFSVQPRGLG